MEFSFDLFSFLICLISGSLAGFVDATVGGGGLIALPALLALGIPPHNIIATNKLHSAIGTGFALHRFHKKGLVDVKSFFPKAFIIAIIFSCFGALAVQHLSAEFIYKLVPIVMVLILLYKIFYFNHWVDEHDKHLIPKTLFIAIFAPLLGFYDGFFGPGAGMLWVFVLVTFLGQNMIKASANTKLINFASTFGALIIFIYSGFIIYKIALVMAVGQIIGSWIGVHLSVKKGAKFINLIFIIMMSILVVRLFYKYYF